MHLMRRYRLPNTLDTRFNMASGTKFLTALGTWPPHRRRPSVLISESHGSIFVVTLPYQPDISDPPITQETM
jgi:hypothetical protein